MDPICVNIDQGFMETCGASSLSGYLVSNHLDAMLAKSPIILRFCETSMKFRRENGGPEEWIIPEYAVSSLLENILSLQEKGHSIKIEKYSIK